ncbi:competence protein ComEC [Scopulibacillus darangshiensis]|uniref:Competence protein ComEC n=1 Tax=Scopulibacillus darangshiensis TaxID=442528 RepID=A0A4R2PD44_9BACL|nr:DNA internalization-related competence protein ComEC/Rec2 [Scopulibacillus darangshiensis]TCP32324.1 competence protein ComEC [Scopulibacillus darangshiensis]
MAKLLGRCHFLALAAVLSEWVLLGERFLIPLGCLIILGCYLFYKHVLLGFAFLAVTFLTSVSILLFLPSESSLNPSQTLFTGKINEIPKIDGNRLSFPYKLREGETVLLTYRLKSNKEKLSLSKRLKVGQHCVTPGQLSAPDPSSNFHAFDYKAYLLHQRIFWILEANKINSCRNTALTLYDHLKQYRQNMVYEVSQRYHPPVSEMINALVFGERMGMDQDVINAYQSLGIIHLLAVSGLHVGLIIGAFYLIALRLGFIREHIMIGLMVIIPIYIVLTGGAPSVIRAGLTAEAVIIGSLFKIKMNSLDIISFVCGVMVIFNPHFLYQLGFQLSFLVTFSILLSAPSVAKKYVSSLTRLVVITIIAQLASFPIVIYHFYELSLLSFLVNLIFIPLITYIVLPLAFVTFLTGHITASLSHGPAVMLNIILENAHRLLIALQKVPFTTLTFGSPPFGLLMMICLGAYLSLCLWEKAKGKRAVMFLVSFFIVTYFTCTVVNMLHSTGKVTFLDVGQGDSILIELPFHRGNILIDTGGILPFKKPEWERKAHPFEVGRDVVLHELKAKGISQIDMLILTHRDYDHIGGFKSLAGKIKIRQIVISDYFQVEKKEEQLFQRAAKKGTKIKRVRAGDILKFGDYQFSVISPMDGMEDSNNDSLVVLTDLGGVSWLFTGDLEKEGEMNILTHYRHLPVDILKVGHHGSKTSTTEDWLDELRPKVAIVSVGKRNRYGHPSPEVLDRLENRQMKIIRTDKNGAVQFSFNKKGLIDVKTVKSAN